MLINLLYMIKDLTRYITPAFVPGTTNACFVRKRQTRLELLNHLILDHLGFTQSQ